MLQSSIPSHFMPVMTLCNAHPEFIKINNESQQNLNMKRSVKLLLEGINRFYGDPIFVQRLLFVLSKPVALEIHQDDIQDLIEASLHTSRVVRKPRYMDSTISRLLIFKISSF